ncbi:uncharacterized protein [Nicotiana sylvestris]|uniref:uncharacterized protein n=1 Tax=Nicotiana sylvestris TaxID=4096 RepID=UPI00388C8418
MTNDKENQTVPMVTVNASTSRTPALAPAEKPEKFFENERFLVIEVWKHSDFLCKNYILSGLEYDLYNVYSGVETLKELWTTLEKKYKTKDVGLKKFVAAKFLDSKMLWESWAQIYEVSCSEEDKKKGQANMVEKHEDVDDLCAMLFECNLVGNTKEWWIDSGATHHVCAIREAFATYAPVGPEETLSMGIAATAKIEGYGKIFLKMTSGKVVTLNKVIHVPEIMKNLVYDGLLVKNSFKCVLFPIRL